MAQVIVVLTTMPSVARARASAPAAAPPAKSSLVTKHGRELRALVRRTAKLRQLWPRRRVVMGVMSRAQILGEIEAKLARDYADDEIAIDSAVLQRLGLLPPGIDYKQALLSLLADQVAGFYDPHRRRLNIADWLPLALQETALVHEICHALQDQHFDLRRFVSPLKSDSDRQLARGALVEGDCTGVMLEHLVAGQGQDLGSLPESTIERVTRQITSGHQSQVLSEAPAYLRQTLTFPYVHGLRFIQRFRQRHSWKQLRALYRRPPRTSEQILHHDKYLRRERAVQVRIGRLPALDGELARVKEDVLGEYQLRLHAALAVADAVAERAAEGWGGDRLVAFARPAAAGQRELPLIIHLSRWDSEADAIEFANAERAVFAKLTARPLAPAFVGLWRFVDSEGLEWSVQRQGADVLLLLAVRPSLRARLQDEVWSRARFDGRRVRVHMRPLPPTSSTGPN